MSLVFEYCGRRVGVCRERGEEGHSALRAGPSSCVHAMICGRLSRNSFRRSRRFASYSTCIHISACHTDLRGLTLALFVREIIHPMGRFNQPISG